MRTAASGTTVRPADYDQQLKALLLREELHKTIFENSLSAKLVFNPNSKRILWANRSAAEFYGRALDQLLRTSIVEIDSKLFTAVQNALDPRLKVQYVKLNYEGKTIYGKNTDFIYLAGRLEIDGNILLFVEFYVANAPSIAMPALIVSEQKNLSEDEKETASKLSHMMRYFSLVSSSSNYYVYSILLSGGTRTVFENISTESFERITGYTPQETDEDGGYMTLIIPSDLPIYQGAEKLLQSQKMTLRHYRLMTKYGKIIYIKDTLFAGDVSSVGTVSRLYGLAEDITEYVRSDRQQNILKSDFLNSDVYAMEIVKNEFPIHLYHDAGLVLEANSEFYSSTHFAPEEVINKSLFDLVDHKFKENYFKLMSKISSTAIKIAFRNKRGSALAFEALNLPLIREGKRMMVLLLRE